MFLCVCLFVIEGHQDVQKLNELYSKFFVNHNTTVSSQKNAESSSNES